MSGLKVGDIVARKSYGGDVYFRIVDMAVRNDGTKVYSLRGLLYRILADAHESDLVLQNPRQVQLHMRRGMADTRAMRPIGRTMTQQVFRQKIRGMPGQILHMDSSEDYLDMCIKFYRDAGIKVSGYVISESEQPGRVRELLARTGADILVSTGHDGLKKDSAKINSVDSYRNSKYFIKTVSEARKYESSSERLCIFAGACQSYYEAIMEAGANFASSPGRVLIHALDPAKVADRVSFTDTRSYVTPEALARITNSGSKGIGGIRTKGHFKVEG